MAYVMTYMASVPEGRKDDFIRMSKEVADVFKGLGCTRVVECWGEDVPQGKVTSYPMAVKAEAGEVVVCGWQEWPDKATRDAAWEQAMQHPVMQNMSDMPFDGKRMIFGGFEPVVDT